MLYIFNLVPTFSIFFLKFRLRKVLYCYRIFYPLDSIPMLRKTPLLMSQYLIIFGISLSKYTWVDISGHLVHLTVLVFWHFRSGGGKPICSDRLRYEWFLFFLRRWSVFCGKSLIWGYVGEGCSPSSFCSLHVFMGFCGVVGHTGSYRCWTVKWSA